MNESNITKLILMHLPKFVKTRLFRNNTGTGWVGKSRTKGSITYIENARPLKAGLCTGSSDLIGWTEKKVTPDMVGKNIAIFTALEIKTPRGKPTKEQLNFIKQIKNSGGIAGVARNEDEALKIIQ
jgi:hypothetical protein